MSSAYVMSFVLFPIGVCLYEKYDEKDFLFPYLENLVREVVGLITVLHVQVVLFCVFIVVIELDHVIVVAAQLVDLDLILGVLLQLRRHEHALIDYFFHDVLEEGYRVWYQNTYLIILGVSHFEDLGGTELLIVQFGIFLELGKSLQPVTHTKAFQISGQLCMNCTRSAANAPSPAFFPAFNHSSDLFYEIN